jgi:hypothetical protein
VSSYPDDNCGAAFGLGAVINPQDEFPNYLNHTSAKSIVAPYLNSSNIAQAAEKPFLMFETNTASCGGFPGISGSFGAALWALDYGMQMAYSNFSAALLHFGGQNVYYNVRALLSFGVFGVVDPCGSLGQVSLRMKRAR